jgi:hypothetical protein
MTDTQKAFVKGACLGLAIAMGVASAIGGVICLVAVVFDGGWVYLTGVLAGIIGFAIAAGLGEVYDNMGYW